MFAPLFGLVVAALFSVPVSKWMQGSGQHWVDQHINQPNSNILLQLASLPFGLLFFYLLVALPFSLKRDGPRYLAYPGFAFYSLYWTAAALAWTRHVS